MSAPQVHSIKGGRLAALLATVALSMLGYLLFTLWGGWQEVVSSWERIGSFGLLAALALSLVNYLLRFLRWHYYLTILSFEVPWLQSLRIYLMGFALTTTPAKAGEALRGVFLKDYGVSYQASFGAFLSERLSDLLAVLILASLGFWSYPEARLLWIGVGTICACLILLVQQEGLLRKIEQGTGRNFSDKVTRKIHFLLHTLLAFRSCYTLRAFGTGIGLGVLAWGAEGAAFYYLLQLMEQGQISFFTAQYIYAFSMIVGAISFLPGGLGTAEVTMLQLLLWQGVGSAEAVAATVIIRLATLWFAVLIGIAVLPYRILIAKRLTS